MFLGDLRKFANWKFANINDIQHVTNWAILLSRDAAALAEFWDWLEEEISKDRALIEVEDFEGEAISKWRFGACNKGKKPSFTDMHGPVVLTIE
ncbi:hypothetical protein K1719_019072 [Acacia pycnantha]|nr:hypothetical protein K1719_019072 [Acacia pycnantha]